MSVQSILNPPSFIRPGNWVRVQGRGRNYLIVESPIVGAGGRWIVLAAKSKRARVFEHLFCDQLTPLGKQKHSEQTTHAVFKAWWRQQRAAAGLPLDCPDCGSITVEAHMIPWELRGRCWQLKCHCGREKSAASKKLAIASWNNCSGRDDADQALLALAVAQGYDLEAFRKDFD